MPTLPSNVTVLVEGYEETPDFNVLRSEMDSSFAKQRPRRSLPIVARSVTLKVGTNAEKIAFEQFFRDDINGGTAFFDYVDPVDNLTKQARFVGGQIRWSTTGNLWTLAAEIETIG